MHVTQQCVKEKKKVIFVYKICRMGSIEIGDTKVLIVQ